jgi:hypothetical protein
MDIPIDGVFAEVSATRGAENMSNRRGRIFLDANLVINERRQIWKGIQFKGRTTIRAPSNRTVIGNRRGIGIELPQMSITLNTPTAPQLAVDGRDMTTKNRGHIRFRTARAGKRL